VPVTVADKPFVAVGAGYVVKSFLIHLVAVLFPPLCAAMCATKGFGLAPWYLFKMVAAVAAELFFRFLSAADRLHCIYRQAELLPDLTVGKAAAAKSKNILSFLTGHWISPFAFC